MFLTLQYDVVSGGDKQVTDADGLQFKWYDFVYFVQSGDPGLIFAGEYLCSSRTGNCVPVLQTVFFGALHNFPTLLLLLSQLVACMLASNSKIGEVDEIKHSSYIMLKLVYCAIFLPPQFLRATVMS